MFVRRIANRKAILTTSLLEKVLMVDSERAGDGFLCLGLEDGAGGAISRSDTTKKGDVEYVPCEGSGDVDARSLAQRVETSAGQRVRSALIDFQPEISQRDAGQLVLYRQLSHRACGRNESRVDGGRLRGFGLMGRCWKAR